MLVADTVIGRNVACSRCERSFEARAQTAASRVGELFLVAAVLVVGVVVAWLILRGR
jgi:hypothetical protein